MIPFDLLDELKADPALWDRLSCFVMYDDGEGCKNTIDIISYGDCPGLRAILQLCLQEAIRERGWNYIIEKFHTSIYAKVTIPHECWTDEAFRGTGDTESETLLRAYLQAVKVNDC